MTRDQFPHTYNKAFNTGRVIVSPKLSRKKKEANAEKKRLSVKDNHSRGGGAITARCVQEEQQPCAADQSGHVYGCAALQSVSGWSAHDHCCCSPHDACPYHVARSCRSAAQQASACVSAGSMCINGIVNEQGKVFLTKRTVCQFYNDIGLSMRRGTGHSSKAIEPAEMDGLKDLLTYRLLFLMVNKMVPPKLVVQFD